MTQQTIKPVNLGFFPTPLMELKRLAAHLDGPQIFMKRDDQTGLAFGGNKVRKLEFLVGDALAKGCDTLITGGAAQSNHCRQTAAAAAAKGLGCHLVLGGAEPGLATGNLLLDTLLGAKLHWAGKYRKGEQIPERVEMLREEGLKPYVIPYGGSNSIGALGFVAAMQELALQMTGMDCSPTHIIFPSSSGGTQAGMLIGRNISGINAQIFGVAIDKEEIGDISFSNQVLALANETAVEIGSGQKITAQDVIILDEYLGQGYGVMHRREQEAIHLVAGKEGILLDPVYTARAMAGLLDLIASKQITSSDRVLFWHTGGTPALFPYGQELTGP